MQTLVVPIEWKQLNEEGEFTGMAAIYEVADMNGDIIRRGAARRTIQQNPEVPIVHSHDLSRPLGLGTLTETEDGVQIRGRLNLDTQDGKDARSNMQKRVFRGLSIGFDTLRRIFIEDEDTGDFTRIIEELRIWEVSPVTVPAQPMARIGEVKSADHDTRNAVAANFERTLRKMTSLAYLSVVDAKAGRLDTVHQIDVEGARDSLTALLEVLPSETKSQNGDTQDSDSDLIDSLTQDVRAFADGLTATKET